MATDNPNETMLDTGAKKRKISEREQPEILSLLPDVSGKKVLELGAGIGRFTGVLAQSAKHLTAVDFMEQSINKNKEINGYPSNIAFMQADVTTLEFPPNSYDLVFINELLMYLSDEESPQLINQALPWLKEGGYLFVRETCGDIGHPLLYLSVEEVHKLAGKVMSWLKKDGYVFFNDKDREFKPTHYRSPAFYNAIFQSVAYVEDDEATGKKSFGFEVMIFNHLKNNPNQYCWLLQKTSQDTLTNHGFGTFQKFLDNTQYSRKGILSYEKVFGDGFISTGGPETTQELAAMLNLQPGQKVLDVGCGIGGGDFYMAKKYAAEVVALDLSSNMIEIAMERATQYPELKVQFEIADVTKSSYPRESFDVVYSRDTIIHIKDKPALFAKFLTWLKPGGKILVSDYCCGELPHSEAFLKYVADRGYNYCTTQQYGKLVEGAGFTNVKAEDRTWQLKDMLKKERKRFQDNKTEFLKDFSGEDFQHMLDLWSNRMARVDSGDQKWGLIYAEKPAH